MSLTTPLAKSSKTGRKRSLSDGVGDEYTPEELERYNIKVGPGRDIQVLTDPLSVKYTYSVGNSIWGASFELVNFLKTHRPDFRGNAVELGAGCGAPGLVLWSRGATVTLTDLPRTLPFMKTNIDLNTTSCIHAKDEVNLVAFYRSW